MVLPDYWLTRPNADGNPRAEAAFDALLHATLGSGESPLISYTLPWPKWQFLCHVAERHDVALHGSGNPEITRFEPRQSHDVGDFGNQKAVYAASDGLWAMFFAIVDRNRFAMSVNNACIRLTDETGALDGPYLDGPYYVFSVSQKVLPHRPWRSGTVYLLPRDTFTPQTPMALGSRTVHIAQLASYVPVQPLAKLAVTPADFPFLKYIRGHDDQRLSEYAAAIQAGAPWPRDT